jgi:Ca2+:H+ antiporter
VQQLARTDRYVIGGVAVATLLAGVGHYASWPYVMAFVFATLSLAGLAHVVALGVEMVGERLGPGIAGLLQATLGNLPELFLVIFALRAGESVVAQNTVIGSIFSNALLVLGLVILVGTRKSGDGVMRFHPRLPNDTATLLMVTVFIIVLVGLSLNTHDPAAAHVTTVSTIAAIALLAVYVSWVVPYIRGDLSEEGDRESGAQYEPDGGYRPEPVLAAAGGGAVAPGPGGLGTSADRPPRAEPEAEHTPLSLSIGLLAFGGVGAAFASDWFIAALSPTVDQVGISRAFAGLVIAAIAGNAVENITAVILAAKGQADLAISVVKNSVGQMAAFMWPALVLISLPLAHSLTFSLHPVYIGALLVTALTMWQITGDGEALPYEGVALIAVYLALAGITLYE